MSITDELRRWAYSTFAQTIFRNLVKKVDEIADRIDAELAERYVKLPIDADGVPIRVGDAIEIEHNGRVTTVTNINYNEYGWQVYCAEGGGFDKDTRCRHVQPDSWERIIKDAKAQGAAKEAGAILYDLARFTDEQLIERCRRLAGE